MEKILKAQGKGGHFFLTDYQLTSQHQQWKSETVESYFPQHTKGRCQMRTLYQIKLSFKNGVFVTKSFSTSNKKESDTR